ncbi:MAG: hypothetical protein GY751_07625 [Bacteroidetes bacterium]|nr:hypothetical protein [Bacteroidota bacterium]
MSILSNLLAVYDVIHMIASPRNISTAVMYSFARRENTRVIDEPFYAYYLEKTGVPHPGFDEILAALPTSSEVVIETLNEKAKKANLFIKNLSSINNKKHSSSENSSYKAAF